MDPATLLTEARTRAGLTQRALAQRAHTSAAAVCMYESGRRIPRVDTLVRLIRASGSTLHLVVEADSASVDVDANGRTIEALLGLVDHLPRRSSRQLEAPVVARMARHER